MFTEFIDLRINWKIWCKRIYLIIVDSIILYMQLPIWCVRSLACLFIRCHFFSMSYHENEETEGTTISDTERKTTKKKQKTAHANRLAFNRWGKTTENRKRLIVNKVRVKVKNITICVCVSLQHRKMSTIWADYMDLLIEERHSVVQMGTFATKWYECDKKSKQTEHCSLKTNDRCEQINKHTFVW